MIKQGLKNYIINLKYFFTPLGAFFLGIIVGLSILLPGTISLLNNLGVEAGRLLNNTNLDFPAFEKTLVDALSKLDWQNANEAIKSLFNYDWLTSTLNAALYALAGDFSSSTSEITQLVDQTIHSFVPLLVWFVFFSLLGIFVGFMLTKFLVRKEIAQRSLVKMIFQVVVDSLLSVTLIAFVLWLLTIWQPSVYLSALVAIIVYGFVSLIEAYVAQGTKTTKFKKIVNLKNVGKLAISNLLILLIGLALVSLISFLINQFVGIFVGVSFLEISFVVISLNAEAYVKAVASKEITA